MTGPTLRTDRMSKIWAAVRGKERFTLEDVCTWTGEPKNGVWHVLNKLVESGHLVELMPSGKKPQRYDAVEKRQTHAGTPEYQMWQTAKAMRMFSATDLKAHLATTDVTLKKVEAYLRVLLKGGYLRVVQKAVPGERVARYQLVRDTGPKPPVSKRIRVIIDPNTGETIGTGAGL